MAALAACTALQAKPARPGKGVYTQPDGTTLMVELHGNGASHWATDASGNMLSLDANGFYRISSFRNSAKRSFAKRAERSLRSKIRPSGEVHIPVLLVEFQDVAFSYDNPQEMFDALLNQEGYSYGGAMGCAGEYFRENSLGAFSPVFDVLPPVTLEKNMAYYGANTSSDEDRAPELAVLEACEALDDEVDFSGYDHDGDGFIDLILLYYAGYDEAEYGPADAIWSQQGSAQDSSFPKVVNAVFDEKQLRGYICTSELASSSGTRLSGIGSTIHEMGHAMGLPDFYDSDGSDNGIAGGMYNYSVMCMGLYNNGGITPPYFNALERIMLGWMDAIPPIPDGQLNLPPVQENAAFMIPSATEGEYFILEARDANGWDSDLRAGLLLYHIDMSERVIDDGITARFLWEDWENSNIINAYGDHPLAYIIPSSKPASLNYLGGNYGVVFPGASSRTFMDPLDWDGNITEVKLAEMSASSALVVKGHGTAIIGSVKNQDGSAVAGAMVRSNLSESIVTSGIDGRFILDLPDSTGTDLPFTLSVSADGYRKTASDGVLAGRSAYMSVSLMKKGESSAVTLKKWDDSAERIFYPLPTRTYGDCMGAVKFNVRDLFPYVGRRIDSISFSIYINDGSADSVYAIVDFGNERVLTREVQDPVFGVNETNVVDVSDADLRIPDGTLVFIGYGVKGSTYVYPLAATLTGHQDNSYFGHLDLESSVWEPMYSTRSKTGFMDLILSADVSEVPFPSSLSDMGYACIDTGKGLWKEGDVYTPSLKESLLKPESVEWFFDGEAIEGESVTLTAGLHTVTAAVTYSGGRNENLKARIQVEQ